MKIGFIGAGKVGLSLAYYFKYNKLDVTGFYVGSHSDNTNADFKIFKELDLLVYNSDIIFITVTDNNIKNVWSRLLDYNIKNKIICHCSGSLSSEIFINADKYGSFVCSVHPILPFETFNVSVSNISKAFFTIEGSDKALEKISEILNKCGNSYSVIDSKNKTKYHIAACFASNFVIALIKKATDFLEECGFEKENALSALIPLIISNVKNIENKGVYNSLTGPVERNDTDTIKNHINVLVEKDKKLYLMLTEILVDIAKEKNKDRDYSAMEGYYEKYNSNF
ncbi:MAG: Rossmann-like and DUF2520 domain-containing protein [Lachnospirales bacterium]